MPLVRAVMAAGAPRDGLTYHALRTLADLDPAVAEVTGFTRYRIEGDPESGDGHHRGLDRGGVAAGIPSRTDQDPRLRGTKHRVATEREVMVATGRRRRPHPRARPRDQGQPGHRAHAAARPLPRPPVGRHRPGRSSRATATGSPLLRDAVTETEPTFRDDLLAEIDVVDLLGGLDHARWPTASAARAEPVVVGIGTDLVDLDRFRLAAERTPGILTRFFTEGERAYAERRQDPTERYAARFAAKEAVMKALGVGLGACELAEIEVVRDEDSGAPDLVLHGKAAALAADRGVTAWKLSLTHTDTSAHAIVIAL